MRLFTCAATILASTAFARLAWPDEPVPPREDGSASVPGAQAGTPNGAAPREGSRGASAESGTALAVDIEPGAAGLDAEALREAIAREASVRVTAVEAAEGPRLFVRGHGAGGLTFEFLDGSRSVTRTIALPEDTLQRRLSTAALVAVGLLEDEAAVLLARLRADAQKAAPPAPPPSPPPPAPPPVPSKRPQSLAPCAPSPEHTRWIGADFAPRLGSSSVEPRGTVRRVSLEFFGGRPGAVNGFEFSPVVSLGGASVCGLQLAGVAGWVSGPLEGLAIAGIAQRTTDLRGVSIGGVANLSHDVRGAQLAGVLGLSHDVSGIQVGGALSLSTGTVRGMQLSAVSIAGEVHGVQVGAGTFARDVHGLQIGAANIGGGVRGVQLGAVNVATDSDASIGLVSIVTQGRTTVHAFAATDGVASVALQHGSRLVHNFYGAGVSTRGVGPMLGLGFHAYESSLVFLDADVLATELFATSGSGDPQSLFQARVVAGLRLSPEAAVYAGPTYDALFIPAGQTPRTFDLGMSAEDRVGNGRLRRSLGLTLGIRGL